ncbi:hypothetical protein L1987_67115 [Smallanthus sonchifolius]|uniref:Uncharacterized protein n=1 Tax=Smallanthus sonchifolius TaxID=185202 RepID=A0ACB9BZF8_9ASTR|nr:hypothetical protein L1987_67115 [Smallanthus sonchifolius]
MTTVITQILSSWKPGQLSASTAQEAFYIRSSGIEFVITLAELEGALPSTIRNRLLGVLLQTPCDIEDDSTAENSHIYDCAKESLTRLTIALDMNNFFDFAVGHLKVFSLSSEWRKRYAALIPLGDISKGHPHVIILSGLSTVVCVRL